MVPHIYFLSLEEDDKVALFVEVSHAFSVFGFVVFINPALFVLPDVFPVGNMLYIKDHVLAKDKLSRHFLQSGMACGPDSKRSGR